MKLIPGKTYDIRESCGMFGLRGRFICRVRNDRFYTTAYLFELEQSEICHSKYCGAVPLVHEGSDELTVYLWAKYYGDTPEDLVEACRRYSPDTWKPA